MSLQDNVMTALKDAMKAKNQTALVALRAIKSALLIAKTSGSGGELSEADEIKLLQKQVKQRKDSAILFIKQGRQDLADPELAEVEIIEQFLPKAMSEDEVVKIVEAAIVNTGAQGMKDMGKVMGVVNEQVAGRADGKTISTIVKQKLN